MDELVIERNKLGRALMSAYDRLRRIPTSMYNEDGKLNPEWNLPIIPDREEINHVTTDKH